MRLYPALLAGLLLSAQAVTAAPVWRWVDEAGYVHFGDQPPSDVDAERMRDLPDKRRDLPIVDGSDGLGEPPPTGSVEAIKAQADELERARNEKAKRRAEEKEKLEEQARLEQNCAQAQSNLKSLTDRGQASILEGDEYRVLNEDERQAKIRDMQQILKEHCGGASAQK